MASKSQNDITASLIRDEMLVLQDLCKWVKRDIKLKPLYVDDQQFNDNEKQVIELEVKTSNACLKVYQDLLALEILKVKR